MSAAAQLLQIFLVVLAKRVTENSVKKLLPRVLPVDVCKYPNIRL